MAVKLLAILALVSTMSRAWPQWKTYHPGAHQLSSRSSTRSTSNWNTFGFPVFQAVPGPGWKDGGWNTGRFPAFQAVPRLNRQRRQDDTTVDNNRGDNKDANRQSEEDDSGGADYGVFDNIFGSERSKSGRSGPKKLIHHGTRSSSWSKGGIPDPAPPGGYLHQPNLATDQKLGKDYVQDPVEDIDALNGQPRQNNRRGSRANYKA